MLVVHVYVEIPRPLAPAKAGGGPELKTLKKKLEEVPPTILVSVSSETTSIWLRSEIIMVFFLGS